MGTDRSGERTAALFDELGHTEPAVAGLQQAVSDSVSAFGPDHPETVALQVEPAAAQRRRQESELG